MWRRFFKLLSYIVLSLYIVSVATFIAVLYNPQWHMWLLRFSVRVWQAFLVHVGSTGPGFISPIILSVLSVVLTMAFIGVMQGWNAMLKHWWETALVTGVVLATTMLAVYGPQLIWQAFELAEQDSQQSAANASAVVNLGDQLSDAKQHAEQQCEQEKDGEIKRLKRQLVATCFNPDRKLTPMETDQLFAALKRIRIEMERQNQSPYIRINGFTGDPEVSRLARQLEKIFQDAGWEFKYPPAPSNIEKQTAKQKEREQWVIMHTNAYSLLVFDKSWPKGFGLAVSRALSDVDLKSDWTQSDRQQTKELPYLEELTLWIGYKAEP
jgi:hypothetical protein